MELGQLQTAFAVNPARVAHETVDGEVIIIQLERGNYYSLAGSGREIWELLSAGTTPSEAVERLALLYAADRDVLETAVADLVERLVEEDLLQAQPGEDHGPSPAVPEAVPAEAGKAFETPKLEKYTDMQDYLLIDPIHDVSEQGWPTVNGAD